MVFPCLEAEKDTGRNISTSKIKYLNPALIGVLDI